LPLLFAQVPGRKMGSINTKLPRRLRKIYIDEKTFVDEHGALKKSFSYFVLPLAFAPETAIKPSFDFTQSPQVSILDSILFSWNVFGQSVIQPFRSRFHAK
jgi:hypothetical protein